MNMRFIYGSRSVFNAINSHDICNNYILYDLDLFSKITLEVK